MLEGKNILIMGARAGGYGASIAQSLVHAGARVFGTTLNPDDPREAAFFNDLGLELIDVPLKFDFEKRSRVFEDFQRIEEWFKGRSIHRLDGLIHAVAGGFPRQPSVMKAVGDILKGNSSFQDMATAVKRNVYYVNAGSFEDSIKGLAGLIDKDTHLVALTYRGDLPYFIADTKLYLERIAARLAKNGKRTLIAAFPEAWTQSSQFFTGIDIAIIQQYLADLKAKTCESPDLAEAYGIMERSLEQLEGFPNLLEKWPALLGDTWDDVAASGDSRRLYHVVQTLFDRLRTDGTFPVLRHAVETISQFVRDASGTILVREFLAEGRYDPGDVRQIHYPDLIAATRIGTAKPRAPKGPPPCTKAEFVVFEKEAIREALTMYGENFLFIDRVVMEAGELRNGLIAFGSFTVPTPDQNPILKDHFVGMPLFGGHLQMEAVAQLGTFVMLKLFKDKRLVPILTGTEFPDLNTMAPPGEKLTIMGVIRLPEKRNLTLDAIIENRFARSKGVIRGMLINQRLVKKMLTSFNLDADED